MQFVSLSAREIKTAGRKHEGYPVNRSFFHIIFFILLTVPICDSFGEGRCPPGYYPIGGQGLDACAPIPGAASNSGAGETIAPPPSQPIGHWVKTWGAIASDVDEGTYGTSVAEMSSSKAGSVAVARCLSLKASKSCKVVFSYQNQCVAMASPDETSGHETVDFLSAKTMERAQRVAVANCEERSGRSCSVMYSNCSDSVFVND